MRWDRMTRWGLTKDRMMRRDLINALGSHDAWGSHDALGSH